jgi:hypothetical protein
MHFEHMPMVECVIPFIIGKVQFPVEQPLTGVFRFWVEFARLLMMPPMMGTSMKLKLPVGSLRWRPNATDIVACWPFTGLEHTTELTACWEIGPIPSKRIERRHPTWTNDL